MPIDQRLADLLARAKADEFKQWLKDLLLRIMEPDTTISPDIKRLAANEAAVFDLLSQAAIDIGCPPEDIRHVPIRSNIDQHPVYTTAYYAENQAGNVYAGRSNLVIRGPGLDSCAKLVINVHIDTVSPHIAASSNGDTVLGRGAVDDKGGCVAAMGALRLLHEMNLSRGDSINYLTEFQFVIDEEMGGNGSLSMALETSTTPDAVVVLEPTELQIHPGNRGATWYHVDLDTMESPRVSPTELAFAAVLAIEEEGLRLFEESEHPLFPGKPVQTCHGMIGAVGEHPSSVCDRVDLIVRGHDDSFSETTVCRAIDAALDRYCAAYGDKVRNKRLEKHIEIEPTDAAALVHVFGISGHMGAVRECDGAILKAAYIWDALPEDVRVDLVGKDTSETSIVIEGGQGFLPDLSLATIRDRIAQAATSGVKALVERRGGVFHTDMIHTSFDKLHNDAFACDVDAPWVQATVRAAEFAGIRVRQPLVGFCASCDARIFAGAFPDADIITFGPGQMAHAHAADEQVNVNDIVLASATLAALVLAPH